MISLELWKISRPLLKLPTNVGDLGKIIVAIGFVNSPKCNKSPNLVTLLPSHTLRHHLKHEWARGSNSNTAIYSNTKGNVTNANSIKIMSPQKCIYKCKLQYYLYWMGTHFLESAPSQLVGKKTADIRNEKGTSRLSSNFCADLITPCFVVVVVIVTWGRCHCVRILPGIAGFTT